jgi:integrase
MKKNLFDPDFWAPGFARLARDCERLRRRIERMDEIDRRREKRKRRKPMSVFKVKKSPFYQCKFANPCGGPPIQKSTKFTNRTAALRFEHILFEKLARKRAGIPEPAEPLPFFLFFSAKYLETKKHALAKNTARNYHISLGVLERFHRKRLDEITAADIEQFQSDRLEAGRSGATINRDLAFLRLVLAAAVRQDLLTTTPFIAGKVTFLKERKVATILSFSEERRYLAQAEPVLHDVATLMVELAMCPGEVFNIRVPDVQLRAAHLHIPTGKTAFRTRDVPITKRVRAVLEQRLEAAEGPYLFPFRVGGGWDWSKPMTTVAKQHAYALKASGVRHFRLYDLRHTGATRAAEGGASPLELQKLLGHSSLSTTMRYVRLAKSHLVGVQQKIERHNAEQEIAEFEAEKGATLQ